jgi:phosphatidylglycerophosphatase A
MNPTPLPAPAPVDPAPDIAAPTVQAAVRPSLAFMLAHPAHCLALGFGSGLLRPAPGTWGTLAGWGAFIALDGWLNATGWLVVIVLTFVLGAAAAQRTGQDLGVPDHGVIVIDEIVAIWVVLLLLPSSLLAQALGVLAFRCFDIVKPPPVRAIDRRWKNGIGVMLDDLMAAFYALLAAALVVRLIGQ